MDICAVEEWREGVCLMVAFQVVIERVLLFV